MNERDMHQYEIGYEAGLAQQHSENQRLYSIMAILETKYATLKIKHDMHKTLATDWKKSAEYWRECYMREISDSNVLTSAVSNVTVPSQRVNGITTQGGM